jgi:hypothetical protein
MAERRLQRRSSFPPSSFPPQRWEAPKLEPLTKSWGFDYQDGSQPFYDALQHLPEDDSKASCRKKSYTLGELVPGSLCVNSLFYEFAALRKIVKQHDELLSFHYPEETKHLPSRTLVHFVLPSLIFTRQTGQEHRKRYLQYNIPPKDILLFVRLNRRHLCDRDGVLHFDETGSNHKPLAFELELEAFLELNYEGYIVEFDDEFSEEELVYSITVDT